MLYEALVIGFGFIGLLFGYLAFNTNKQHQLLISLFMAVSVLTIVLIPIFLTQAVAIEKYDEVAPDLIGYYTNIETMLTAYTIFAIGTVGLFAFYLFFLGFNAVMQMGLEGFMGIKSKEE